MVLFRHSDAQKAVSGLSMQQPSAPQRVVHQALWRPGLVRRAPKAEAEAEAGGGSDPQYGGVFGGIGNVGRLLLFCPIRCSRVRACWWWGWG